MGSAVFSQETVDPDPEEVAEHSEGILQGVDPPNNVAFEEALPLAAVLEAGAPFGITA